MVDMSLFAIQICPLFGSCLNFILDCAQNVRVHICVIIVSIGQDIEGWQRAKCYLGPFHKGQTPAFKQSILNTKKVAV